jgi:hypothetical protein
VALYVVSAVAILRSVAGLNVPGIRQKRSCHQNKYITILDIFHFTSRKS